MCLIVFNVMIFLGVVGGLFVMVLFLLEVGVDIDKSFVGVSFVVFGYAEYEYGVLRCCILVLLLSVYMVMLKLFILIVFMNVLMYVCVMFIFFTFVSYENAARAATYNFINGVVLSEFIMSVMFEFLFSFLIFLFCVKIFVMSVFMILSVFVVLVVCVFGSS